MPTPHIEAKLEDIAKTVIMPGDPKRAKFMAEKYLENPVLINSVRGILGYTGLYKGELVTIMAHGMGIPSMGIYSYELFKFYDVDKIIRIGTCGAYKKELLLGDLILVTEAYSESTYAKVQNNYNEDTISSSPRLTNQIADIASISGLSVYQGKIHSCDVFYQEHEDYELVRDVHECLGVEMESFALFHNAKVLGKEAACILTVSDSLVNKQLMSSEEREKNLTTMMELALESI